MSSRKLTRSLGVVLLVALLVAGPAAADEPELTAQAALGTSFTYQGRLTDGGGPASGLYDFEFRLFDGADPTIATQVGATVSLDDVAVSGGLFTVSLDFGHGIFTGAALWLQVSVRPGSGGTFQALAPLTAVSGTPYALFAADTAGTPYANVVVVAKSGGDFTSIQAAIDSITSASATDHYLVWVAPGVYTERVTMKPYIDIEGAGRFATTITYTGSAASDAATLVTADNCEVRSLKVENTGGDTYAMAIYHDGGSTRLSDMLVSASGGSANYCILNVNSATTVLSDVTAAASGGTAAAAVLNDEGSALFALGCTFGASGATANNNGVLNYSSSMAIDNCTILGLGGTTSYGIFNSAGSGSYTVLVQDSAVGGTTASVRNDSEFALRIGASQLTGGALVTAGTAVCAGVYDENYTFSAAACP